MTRLHVVRSLPCALLLVLMAGLLPAKAMPPADKASADAAYVAKDWKAAAVEYEALTKAEPASAQYWYRWGVSLAGLGQYKRAIECYDKADAIGFHKPSILLRKAKAYARLGENDKAFGLIESLMDMGVGPIEEMNSDPDIAVMKNDPRYEKDRERAEEVAHPCMHQPEHLQFDFWVGEWDVKPTGGENVVGQSKIEKILDGCVVLENWTGGFGGTGKSFNTYDANTKKWEQYWVDSSGSRVYFIGNLNGATMDYFADTEQNGKTVKRHLQFLDLDKNRVRQFSQQSSDGGKTWTTEYDFTYYRKAEAN